MQRISILVRSSGVLVTPPPVMLEVVWRCVYPLPIRRNKLRVRAFTFPPGAGKAIYFGATFRRLRGGDGSGKGEQGSADSDSKGEGEAHCVRWATG